MFLSCILFTAIVKFSAADDVSGSGQSGSDGVANDDDASITFDQIALNQALKGNLSFTYGKSLEALKYGAIPNRLIKSVHHYGKVERRYHDFDDHTFEFVKKCRFTCGCTGVNVWAALA